MKGIEAYWRISANLIPIAGLFFIFLKKEENKWRWVLANITVTIIIIISALQN